MRKWIYSENFADFGYYVSQLFLKLLVNYTLHNSEVKYNREKTQLDYFGIFLSFTIRLKTNLYNKFILNSITQINFDLKRYELIYIIKKKQSWTEYDIN